jgi:hypothetical protein
LRKIVFSPFKGEKMSSVPSIESSNSSTILERSSSQNFLTPLQYQADQLVGEFADQATDLKTLCAMAGAGAAYRWGRLASLSLGTQYLAEIPGLVRIGSFGIGLATESATFAGLQRSFKTFEGQSSAQSFSKEWLNTALSLGSLKFFGKLSEGQNLTLQHLFSDLGMVGAHHGASFLGIEDKPEGDFFTQLLHAEAMNWQLKVGMNLVHSLAPEFSASERSMDLLLKVNERRLGSDRPMGLGLSLSSLAVEPAGPLETSESEGKNLPLQMASSGTPPGGSPPPSVEAPFRDPSPAEIEWIRQQFGPHLLYELFGQNHESATRFLATLYVHRAEMREKYPPYVFAQADLPGKRFLLRSLVQDSQLGTSPSLQAASRTLAQVSFFTEALNLLIYFQDHNQKALNQIQLASIGKQVTEAAPSRVGEPRGTNPLPSGFMDPKLIVGGEQLPILTNVRGNYELGREHFFGDPAVSTRHFLLNFHMGLWYLLDAQSTYGTYYYDAKRKSWEAYSKEHWALLQTKDLLNIGNAYYKMNILGGKVQFEPVTLPADIEPNAIRRFISVTLDGSPFRMELASTRHGERGSLQIGDLLFRFEGERHYLLYLGPAGAVQFQGVVVPTALDPHSQVLDESKRLELKNGDRLQYHGKTYQVRTGDGGSVDLNRASFFATYIPPPSEAQKGEAFNWLAPGAPAVQDGVLKMNQSQVFLIGQTGEKGSLEAKKGSPEVWEYSMEKKPWYHSLLWFLSPHWIRIQKDPTNQRFEIINEGVKEGVFIQDGSGKNLAVPMGGKGYLKPRERLAFRGQTLVVLP